MRQQKSNTGQDIKSEDLNTANIYTLTDNAYMHTGCKEATPDLVLLLYMI